jgi:hypothetical protein
MRLAAVAVTVKLYPIAIEHAAKRPLIVLCAPL